MISQNTIEAVRDLDIVQVVRKYGTELKKEGSQHTGCCPFHKEKTASFKIWEAKQTFKCFGCGQGGDGIGFVMELRKLDFTGAITDLANSFSITIEYDESKTNQDYQKRDASIRNMAKINQLALDFYQSLTKQPEPGFDSFTKADYSCTIEEFELCYSGTEWNQLAMHLKLQNADFSTAEKLKLLSKKKDGTGHVDFFRNRLLFPIHNTRGQVVGFGGRALLPEDEKKAKYYNSPTSDIYQKESTLYGLFQAKAAIEKAGKAFLAEGYTDVVAMNAFGYKNTVAACGTAITRNHAKLLRRHCSHVDILTDGDKAGRQAAQKSVTIILKEGLTCNIYYLPEGDDPESFLLKGNDLKNLWPSDAVEERLNAYFDGAETVPERAKAVENCQKFLALLQSDALRTEYANKLKETQDLSAKAASDLAKNASSEYRESEEFQHSEADKVKLPPGVNRADYNRHGFYQREDGDKTGIYFANASRKPDQQSNCTIKPLFHIYSQEKDQNTRILQINNGHETRIINPPSNALMNLQGFKETLFREGNFLFFGNVGHLLRMVTYMGPRFPRAVQLNVLGWQNDGKFFAFADGIFTDRFTKAREDGMVEKDGEFYFLPAFSNIYSQIREGEDDLFEEDRKLKYRPSDITFSDYADQCKTVFAENGTWSVCWFAAALFRSIIHSQLDFFPHLFLQGEKGSGKSAIAWALSDIIYRKRMPFNLYHGTDAGFAGRMESDRDCIAWLDEYTNDLKDERFQALKAAYDGAGREKKNMSNLKKNKVDKVLNASLISGQYLPTRDDNSLYSRSILLEVLKPSEGYTAEQRKAFAKINEMREAGLSSVLTELLKMRPTVERDFGEAFHTTNETLRELIKEIGARVEERVLSNVAIVLAIVSILEKEMRFPVTLKTLEQMAVNMIIRLSEQLDDTSSLATFWRIFEQLAMKRVGNQNGQNVYAITEGLDFAKIVFKATTAITIQVGKKETKKVVFDKDTEVLCFRLNKIHGEYMKEHKSQTSEHGLQIPDLKGYFRNAPGYLGSAKDVSFNGKRTTAFAFLMDEVPIAFNRSEKQEESPIEEEPEPINDQTQAVPALVEDDDMPF